jgi:uncharacterized membrane protein
MRDTLLALLNDPAVPSLHVLLVHFPIALLVVALLFDLGCLFFRRRVWLDRTATSLYFVGTIGAGAAYLSGQRAAAALQEISGTAEATLADHQDLALATLAAFSGVTLLRMLVSWLARNDRRIQLGIFRLAALPIAIAGLALLALTADRGGALVYRHGVGVEAGPRAGDPR